MRKGKITVHPSAPWTPELVLMQLNEHHPRIQSMVVAYEYVDEHGELVTETMLTDAEFLARLVDEWIQESLADLN
jgi:hypothetical protein